jgi:hypothetical protein
MTRSSKRKKISKISKIIDDPAYFELDPAQVERVSKLDQTVFNILNILANDPTTLASIDTEKLVEIIRDFFGADRKKLRLMLSLIIKARSYNVEITAVELEEIFRKAQVRVILGA